MTIDELITRLEDLKKVAKNGGKTEVKLYKPNYLYKDEAYEDMVCELSFVAKDENGEAVPLDLAPYYADTCQILTIC